MSRLSIFPFFPRFSCLMLLFASVAFPLSVSAAQVQIVDQSYTYDFSNGGSGFAIANGWSVAQTFRTGLSGWLSQVDVAIFKGSTAVADLTLSVWSTTTSGVPLSKLASSTLSASVIPDLGDTQVISFGLFSHSVEVQSGTLLGIRLDSFASNDFPYTSRYNWAFQAVGGYSAGRSFVYGGTTALNQAAADFYFVTYITPVPEPAVTGLGVAGLILLCRSRHK